MVDLSHMPGPRGFPFVGQSLRFLRDPYGTYNSLRAAHGDVFKVTVFGLNWVVLAGPDAVEEAFLNRTGAYSAKEGLRAFAFLFSGGLLHRDGEDHRAHRRVMQSAFRADAMKDYLRLMNAQIAQELESWPVGHKTPFAEPLKLLSLRLGAHVFMGLTDPEEIARINAAFSDEVAATSAMLRVNLPFTRYGRGIAARRTMAQRFRGLIAERRTGGGPDFFSQMCLLQEEANWTDQEIVDHFNFLLIAAHDPVTSNLAVVLSALAQDPALQETVRAEVRALPEGSLRYEDLGRLDALERCYREGLRRYPPSSFTARRVMTDVDWRGHRLPAGTHVVIAPGPVMMDGDLWPAPERFDPGRFHPERAEDGVHRFAFAPFGGGVHKCIGMHFGTIQFKAIMIEVLRRFRVEAAVEDAPDWRLLPTPTARNGLPLVLREI